MDYPPIPFRNAMSGPAGEYSDAYQQIVQQYRDDLASAQSLRDQQEGRMPALPTPRLIHKSGNDIVSIDPTSGSANLLYRAPGTPPRPLPIPQPKNPYVDPREMEMMRAARDAVNRSQKRFETLSADPNTDSQTLMAAQLDAMDAQQKLEGFAPPASNVPALNPQPALTVPTTTTNAPAYRPAPMMAPGEVAPPGSLVMGRRNTLDAPPSTTQAATRVLDADTAKQILAKVNGDKVKARELAVQLGYSLK